MVTLKNQSRTFFFFHSMSTKGGAWLQCYNVPINTQLQRPHNICFFSPSFTTTIHAVHRSVFFEFPNHQCEFPNQRTCMTSAHSAWQCPCISVIPKQRTRRSCGPLKGTMSAQKALQGSEIGMRELLGGTKDTNIVPDKGLKYGFLRSKQKKIQFMVRPVLSQERVWWLK